MKKKQQFAYFNIICDVAALHLFQYIAAAVAACIDKVFLMVYIKENPKYTMTHSAWVKGSLN